MTTATTSLFGLHVDQSGLICGQAADSRMQFSDTNAESVVAIIGDSAVRVLGLATNAAIISHLYSAGRRVYVGRPRGVDWLTLSGLPRATLSRVVACGNQPASMGGWRRMVDADLPCYQLAARRLAGLPYDAEAGDILARHPAYRALRFIGHADLAACAVLLGEIIDPRWYVDQLHPDRNARLKCFLGLHRRDAPRSSARAARREAAIRSWKSTHRVPTEASAPGHFLWRQWATCVGDDAAADLATTRRFISYVKATWLDSVVRDPDGPMFRYVDFFNDAETAAAWQRFDSDFG